MCVCKYIYIDIEVGLCVCVRLHASTKCVYTDMCWYVCLLSLFFSYRFIQLHFLAPRFTPHKCTDLLHRTLLGKKQLKSSMHERLH